MANPRELAEQAFALLHNALSESEARASDLDELLKRKRSPKNRLEEQLDVLTHRLESVEAERSRWEQQAGHLEEIAEAERVKVAQLKKKLEIAESGPEKLTKKEVNFWRAKAESIDAQIKEYQERLTALRRDLNERDAQLEELRAADGQAEAEPASAPASSQAAPDDELRRQLEQRDEWLAELRLELHELRAQPAPPLETQAEVETLRSQITGLERALAQAHNMRASAQADAMRTEHEIAERERALRDAAAERERAVRETLAEREHALREAAAASERARITLTEREHRIVELTAEVEQLRNELRQRDELDRANATRYEEQIAALARDTEALRGRLEQDKHDMGAAKAALEVALHEREHEIEKQQVLLSANERDFDELRRQLAEREQGAADARHRVEELRRQLDERERECADRQQQLRDLSQAIAERDERASASADAIEHLRASLAAREQEVDSLRETLHGMHTELEQARAALAANERDLASLRETLGASGRELDELRAARARLEATLADAARDMDAAREQMSGLEAELKEEREHAESLGELANERREHMTKLQEQVEEAEERFADANWRLGKALYFERIVKRRKGLIQKLLEALRGKMKANVALKAGLDGLRTFKQTAEMNQHKLLQRIDSLKAELKESEETVKRHQGGTVAKEELTNAVSRAAALEERLNTQAELIQTLEADLKTARLAQQKTGNGQPDEVARLTKQLEAKTEIIQRLQTDTDDQQRKLAKLRGSESETVRLKALTEKDRSEIETLQREIAQLREALTRQSAAAATNNTAELEAKLKERESSVTRLMGTIKEHESTIKKLTESAESWKRKYHFLASDQPDAYKNSAEK
jgi:chromosome segregation ATPase